MLPARRPCAGRRPAGEELTWRLGPYRPLFLPSDTEHVVIARRGAVPEDQGESVEVEQPQVVDPAADPLAIARVPLAAVGVVLDGGAALESERPGGRVERPAPETVTADG